MSAASNKLLARMDQWLGGFEKNKLKSVPQNGGGLGGEMNFKILLGAFLNNMVHLISANYCVTE